MTIVVLHLSDIHIRSARDPILEKGGKIAACIYSELNTASAVFVVVSGDIAYSGKSEQYKAATDFFISLRNSLLDEKNIPVHFVFAPGNHDCDFSLHTAPRQLTLDAVRSKPELLDDNIIQLGTSIQVNYRSFVEQLESPAETRVGDTLWTNHRFTVEGKEVVFDTLNVSWCSNLNEEPGSLIFPVDRYKHHLKETVDLRIAVLHHPLNWFNQAVYHPFRQLVRSLSNVVISGHEHVGGAGEDMHSDMGNSAYLEGCVLQGQDDLADSSFNVAILDLTEGEYRSTRYQWNGLDHYLATDEGSWADFRSLPKKTENRFLIDPNFEKLLTDPGGVFNIKGAVLTLQDLYIYPDVQELLSSESRGVRSTFSTTIFHELSRLDGGVLLTGEEKVGATSLLYMLFRNYHARGLLPIYLRGTEIKQTNARDIENLIKRTIISQYGQQSLELFQQKPSSQKILLLDDLDEGPLRNSQYRAKVLVDLASRFKKMLVTAGESFDFNGAIRPHAEGKLSEFKEFKILPFGYSRRAQLVGRWVQRTSTDGSLDENQLLERCDRAERMLDVVMARNIVPSLPLYLLTLLQSFDSGTQGGFEDSGLGEYYDYLMKNGLNLAGVPRNQWGSIIEYCSHLAWDMHTTEHKEMSQMDLRIFNDRYSDEQLRVELGPRIDALVKSQILARTGDCIRFRYHYIYYFLKGRYLSKKMGDSDVQSYVKICCAHLYVRENANTVLFLAHHAFKDPQFLTCVTDAVEVPFKDCATIAFNGQDTHKVKEFVRDLPKLTYSGKSPEKSREDANKHHDAHDNGSDGLADKKEDFAEDDFAAHLISLFKAVEILGQILKNQIASVPRAQRVDLLSKVMSGPLRAVSAYFQLFLGNQAAAQVEITEMLAKQKALSSDEERGKAARHLLAWLLQTSAAGIILKAIVSVSSDELLEDIRSAAQAIDAPSARLIATGVKLDGPGRLPQKEIESLLKEFSDDFIAARVLQLLILRRLYMFRTDERDKQWLASKELVGLEFQHAVEFKSRKAKLLRNG